MRSRSRCWLARDPSGEAGGINLYGYVGNNPISRIDPLGLNPADGSMAMAGIGGGTMGTTIGEINSTATVVSTAPGASAAQAITQINAGITILNSPGSRITYGTFDVVTGPINVVGGAGAAAGGGAVTFAIPGVGQVAGPAAVAFGWSEMGIGVYKIINGWKDIAEGIDGKGLNIPLLPVPQAPQFATPAPTSSPCHSKS